MIHNAFLKYQTANENTSKTKQVVMLYEGIIKFLGNAKQAIIDKNLEERFNNIEKANEIFNGLQLSLDHENGGEVAVSLDNFYTAIMAKLSLINIKHGSADDMELIIDEIKSIKEAWQEVDIQHNAQEPEHVLNDSDISTQEGLEINI